MKFEWKKFSELTTLELYEILAVRQVVFAVEQNCVYLDADGYDLQAWHLFCWNENQTKITAYLRVLPAKLKYEEPAIGRVITSPDSRGLGLGKALMREAIKNVEKQFGKKSIRISAQAYLEKFYSDLGFNVVGEPYFEDKIPHIEMLLS